MVLNYLRNRLKMDTNTASTDSNQIPPLLTEDQKNSIFEELGLANLPEERKTSLMDEMVDTVLNRIFMRISSVLSQEDVKTLADLELKDDGGVAINQFLQGRVPNLDAIAKEEVESFRSEIKDTIKVITDLTPS